MASQINSIRIDKSICTLPMMYCRIEFDGKYYFIISTNSDLSSLELQTGDTFILHSAKDYSLAYTSTYTVCLNTIGNPIRDLVIRTHISKGYNMMVIQQDEQGYYMVNLLDTGDVQPVIYDELCMYRDKGKLIPGRKYRIIDYESVFDSSSTFGNRYVTSAGHSFDLIVTAISENELDSEASAATSIRDIDGYFSSCDLSKWKISYTIDNSIGAISVFGRQPGFTYSRNNYINSGSAGITSNNVTYYEFTNIDTGTSYYLTNPDPTLSDKSVYRKSGTSSFTKVSTFTKGWSACRTGTGIIYRMEDEYGNVCPYDFKNALYYSQGGVDYRYTFSASTNLHGGKPVDFSLDGSSYGNVINPNLDSANKYKLNNIILLGRCSCNTFGIDSYSITLQDSKYNVFGDRCQNVSFVYTDGRTQAGLMEHNIFGSGCINLSLRLNTNTYPYRYIVADSGLSGIVIMDNFIENAKYNTIITTRPTGEIVYGSIEDLINTLSLTELVISRTYSELLNESNRGLLIPGMKYRITDFKTKCVSTYTPLNLMTIYDTLGIVEPIFDIIVTAVDESTLSEDALLAPHITANPYSLKYLEKYKIKYSLYNDTSKYDWVSPDATGVVYYMKDNWGNEAYYDFKSIMFRDTIDGNAINTFTFSYIYEDSNSGLLVCDDFSIYNTCTNNKIGEYIESSARTRHINCVRFYRYNSSCTCANNIIGNNSYSILFSLSSGSFMNNVIGNHCADITFNESCSDNRIGNGSSSIILTSSLENTIGDNCNVVDISSGARLNTIGDSCSSVSLNSGSMCNTIGHKCNNIQLGLNSAHNKIGSSSNNISISASQCQYNVFGNNCFNITMSNNSSYNTFGENCFNIKAGAFFQLNTFGDYCNNIYFTKTMVTSTSGVMDTNLRDYCQNNVFAKDTSNISIYKDCTSCLANRINNLNVVYPRQSTDTVFVPIEITNLNINYEMLIRRNSAGELRMFNLSDFVIE